MFCIKCLNEKKNVDCFQSCYLFNNNLNYINQIYNISKYPLPKNCEIKLYFSSVDRIRSGITLDKNIINHQTDYNEPKYNIFYILEDLKQFYSLDRKWTHFKGFERDLQSGDSLIIILSNEKIIFKVNENQIFEVSNISLNDDKERYLLVHNRNLKSKCNIAYITEIIWILNLVIKWNVI